MSSKLVNAAAALLAILSVPVLAGSRDVGLAAQSRVVWEMRGQYPAPPSVAARSALPECGFAAIESWGQNGFQYCDARNVH